MNRFNVKPEQARARNEENPLNRIIDGSEDLEEIEKAYKLLEKQNNNELHGIRKKHLKQLFILTCVLNDLVTIPRLASLRALISVLDNAI
ncbi:hypothetical protein ACM22J_04210 [Glaesserella parasuis]|uniref:hypothetical protein n=1 Tax=Glaesserella parasuis TaxID=738 RepID=UPI003CF5D8E6